MGILKDFFKIEKMSKRSTYRVPDHFLRPSMVLKASTGIPGQVPKQWEAWAIHILDTPESSLTLAYKQNIAKNSLKIEF